MHTEPPGEGSSLAERVTWIYEVYFRKRQAEMATACGLDEGVLSKVRRGITKTPTEGTLHAILAGVASVAGVRLSEAWLHSGRAPAFCTAAGQAGGVGNAFQTTGRAKVLTIQADGREIARIVLVMESSDPVTINARERIADFPNNTPTAA